MKKTTFKQPRQASPAADQWVMAGSATPAAPARENAPVGKPARLTIDLPEELHSRFKAACARNRTKMKTEVLQFIEEWTAANGTNTETQQ